MCKVSKTNNTFSVNYFVDLSVRSPSENVSVKNMVGPGEVDEELEPEVKEECEGKYGEINSVWFF